MVAYNIQNKMLSCRDANHFLVNLDILHVVCGCLALLDHDHQDTLLHPTQAGQAHM